MRLVRIDVAARPASARHVLGSAMSEPDVITPEGPCDPDRSWAWRDFGDGAEDEPGADDGPEPPDGPVDTDASFAAAMARYPSLVTW